MQWGGVVQRWIGRRWGWRCAGGGLGATLSPMPSRKGGEGRQLAAKGKRKTVVITAIAREIGAFLRARQGPAPDGKRKPSSPPIPGANIEKAYQDRYALAPRSGAGSPPVQWLNLRPLFTFADLGINTYPEPRPN